MNRVRIRAWAVALSVALGIGLLVAIRSRSVGSGGLPRLRVVEVHKTLAATPAGESARATFQIENTGGGELVVSDIVPTCGCTKATIIPPRLPAGSRGTLSIEFQPPLEPAEFAHAVNFRTNDPSSPASRVTFSGRASWPVEARPTGLRLEATEADPAPTTTIELYGTTGNALEITDVKPSEKWIRVVPLPEITEPHRKRFSVRVDPAADRATRVGSIRFETSERERPVLIVPVACEVRSRVGVTPARLMLNPAKPRSEVTARFMITVGRGMDAVTEVESVGGGWEVRKWAVTRLSEDRFTCQVNLGLPAKAGYSRSGLVFFGAG